jgi:PAS domain S-box-containing protein
MLVTDARAPDNPIVWVNEAFLNLTGYRLEELQGRNCRLLQGPGTDPADVDRIRHAVATARPVSVELLNYRKDGTPFWNAMTVTPVHDAQGLAYFFASQTDTTRGHRCEDGMSGRAEEVERQVSERTTDLRAALDQKTALIHEIDHRVKNNLQVISSLMLLKARRTPPGEARTALESMAERIGALSTAHRLLYSEENSTQFDLRDFVAELMSDMNAALVDDRVQIETDIAPLSLPATMAAPLALLIHELSINAVRHAYPGDRRGRVAVVARRTDGGMSVEVRDDGIGLDPAAKDRHGFGRSLVEMVVRQLRGGVAWSAAEPGTRILIEIPLPEGT